MTAPAILFAVQRLPYIIIPVILTYQVLSLTLRYADITLPTWLLIIVSLFSLPANLSFKHWYRMYRYRKEAAAAGAILPPAVKDNSFAGFHTLQELVRGVTHGYISDPFLSWTEKYGPIVLFDVMFDVQFVTMEPDHIKCLLATQFDNFVKGPDGNAVLGSFLGNGIFSTDGDMWKFHRGISRPFFSKERIGDFDNFERHSKDALDQAQARIDAGSPVDFQDLVSRFTLDSATEYLFGYDVGTLSAGLSYPPNHPLTSAGEDHHATKFAHALVEGQDLTVMRARRGGNWQLWEPWKDEVAEHRAVLDNLISPIVERALEDKANDVVKHDPKDEGTMLDHLVKSTDDKAIIRDTIINMLVAGRDTTASTLTFTVHMLAEHPNILAKLRDEIMNTIGAERYPTYQDIRGMKYLRAVINETLRLYPPVPYDGRTSVNATTFPNKEPGQPPLYIPAKTRTTYSIFLMHRRKDLWGPDALEFDPERWLDERLHKYFIPNPFIFCPFNAGPRICLGQQFAYQEASYFIIRLLQRFESFTLRPEVQHESLRPPSEWLGREPGSKGRDRIWPRSHLTMYSRGGLWLTMNPVLADAI